jgi:hypothetical protein
MTAPARALPLCLALAGCATTGTRGFEVQVGPSLGIDIDDEVHLTLGAEASLVRYDATNPFMTWWYGGTLGFVKTVPLSDRGNHLKLYGQGTLGAFISGAGWYAASAGPALRFQSEGLAPGLQVEGWADGFAGRAAVFTRDPSPTYDLDLLLKVPVYIHATETEP